MFLNKVLFSSVALVILSGCAHPIKIAPDIAKIEQRENASAHITASVGYYIPPELESLEVTTPGGGGDNVRYYPYRAIEPGFTKMLSNVFSGVVKLPAAPVFSGSNTQRLDYIIQPQLVTSSGSTGFFTWPPTNFSVDLTSNIRDATGKMVASPRVVGVGTAETGERLTEHGIAGIRAMEDALIKMQAAMQEQKLGSQEPIVTIKKSLPQSESGSATTRLSHIKGLMENGTITKNEYDTKRKEILDTL